MPITSLGDLAQSIILRRSGAEAKAQIQRLSTELTTGLAHDRAAHLSGNLSPLAGIEASLARLQGFRNVTSDMGLTAGVMQTVLSTVEDSAGELSGRLLAAASSFSPDQVSAVAQEAVSRLDTVMNALNTRYGDRTVFAGVAPNQPAVVSSTELLDLLEGVVASATSAQDVETLVSDWFSDPAGFAAQAYRGGRPLEGVLVAPGEQAQLDVTALSPEILETLSAMALPALLARGILTGQTAGQADLAKRAGERLLEGATGRSQLAARLGTTEAQLDGAATRNAAETSALEIARADLIGVDSFETATRLEAAQTQLETLYAMTARMQRLNLVDYL